MEAQQFIPSFDMLFNTEHMSPVGKDSEKHGISNYDVTESERNENVWAIAAAAATTLAEHRHIASSVHNDNSDTK